MTTDELRSARKQLGLTQAEFAVALGMDRATVSNWERGAKPVPSWMGTAIEGLLCRRDHSAG
jgi:DNA-binding transcriptional regulator YiaG